jgi:pimeloyl-ACP methyl ester carboxylesterase
LLTAAALSIAAAAFCAWGALCLLFWQGSWQLLYHPASAITRTPASAGLTFDPVAFATTEAAEARLKGWWIPAEPGAHYGRFTVLYLHGQDGNLSDSINALAALHQVGLNVFAFDYRGYGQSQFQRPSESGLREDADWAIQYLTGTRHVAANTIILDGRDLGANLAVEVAAAHPELAGVVLESPLEEPMNAIFNDPRAHMVPAHLLVRDRFYTEQAAAKLKIPSLWIYQAGPEPDSQPPSHLLHQSPSEAQSDEPEAFRVASEPKMLVWLSAYAHQGEDRKTSLARWLDDLAPGSIPPVH